MTAMGLMGLTLAAGGDGGFVSRLFESNLVSWVAVLAALGLMPFVLTMVTSFAKLVIVGGILRQALGTQQVPPTTVITGLALILTLHIMWPVASEIGGGVSRVMADPDGSSIDEVVTEIVVPFEGFLSKHSDPRNVALFRDLRARLAEEHAEAGRATPPGAAEPSPDAGAEPSHADDPQPPEGEWFLKDHGEAVTVLAPAFILTELTEAFQIGFLIFIPFLVIDLVVSNILLALGMHMLSPVTVSLPLKLLLFVLMDGWQLVIQGLVLGYA